MLIDVFINFFSREAREADERATASLSVHYPKGTVISFLNNVQTKLTLTFTWELSH